HQFDSHMRLKDSLSNGNTLCRQKDAKLLVERLSILWRGGMGKAWAASLACVTIKCELTHDQGSTAHIFQRQVHFSGLIVENPQSGNLARQITGLVDTISMGNPQQYQ